MAKPEAKNVPDVAVVLLFVWLFSVYFVAVGATLLHTGAEVMTKGTALPLEEVEENLTLVVLYRHNETDGTYLLTKNPDGKVELLFVPKAVMVPTSQFVGTLCDGKEEAITLVEIPMREKVSMA